jgi:hypothetical protein
MLVEYALVPDIFDLSSYSNREVCEAYLRILKPILMEEALVRDLRDGEWLNYVKNWIKDLPEQCHPKAKELLRKLKNQQRFRKVAFCGVPEQPDCHVDWCDEALASHSWQPLAGVITSPEVMQQHRDNPIVASISRMTTDDWTRQRGSSIEIPKQSSAYLNHLRLLLSQASSIQFIDPYLDPSQAKYGEFHFLLQAAKYSDIPPLIEIHTSANGVDQERRDRSQFTLPEWKTRFRRLSMTLQDTGLTLQVFVWKYFHDRYILTNLTGIALSGGLDVSHHDNASVIWSRLPRYLRDAIQADFHPNASKYELLYQFTLP